MVSAIHQQKEPAIRACKILRAVICIRDPSSFRYLQLLAFGLSTASQVPRFGSGSLFLKDQQSLEQAHQWVRPVG